VNANREGVLLSAVDIAKDFGGIHALSGVSLDVERGECLAIIGPNGAGKTTFFNVLTGLLRPSAGRVVFDGVDITDFPAHRRSRIGLARTMQITSVFLRLSVLDNVLIGVQARHSPWNLVRWGVPDLGQMTARAQELVSLVGLEDQIHTLCAHLAHGDQRRVEVALAMSSEAKLVLLDEPTAGLSPKETLEITARLRDIWHREKLTLIIVEHDMEVAMGLASRVAVLHQGECIAIGEPEAIMADETVNRVYLRGEGRAGT
jgi:branched-chain amino acid transport system ATP-binding protein